MELEPYQIPSGVVLNPPPPPPLPPPLFPVINHSSLPPPPLPLPPPSGVLLPFPFHPSLFFAMDHQRSLSLLQFVNDEGLVPSQEEEEKRKKAIQKLKEIVSTWIKKVAWQRRLPKHQIAVTSATILTYGSYGLGVHTPASDIDALCVAPFFATIAEDFFIVLHDMLKRRPEVSEIHCVKSAKVPLMRLKFDRISIDLPYARLRVLYVPENVDILNPFFMRNIDDTSWKSLSGVRANKRILQLVPNVENFQSMLRILKFWAKRRGVYGADLLKPDFIWDNVFQPFPYSKRYSQFVKIYLSTPDQCELGNWVGWVKSRFRGLLVILEGIQGFCDPNPTEYVDNEKGEPNVVFYWGLQPADKNNLVDIELVEGEFMKIIGNGYEGTQGRMELSILIASQLPKNAQFDEGTIKGRKTCWKVIDYDKKRNPLYSQHLPHCLVGQVASSGEAECLSSGG